MKEYTLQYKIETTRSWLRILLDKKQLIKEQRYEAAAARRDEEIIFLQQVDFRFLKMDNFDVDTTAIYTTSDYKINMLEKALKYYETLRESKINYLLGIEDNI